jgi:hypothetical protein
MAARRLLLLALLLGGCVPEGCTTSKAPAPDAGGLATRQLLSEDILARSPVTPLARVRHVQIGWDALPDPATRPLDRRARARPQGEAAVLALEVYDRARRGERFEKMMESYSEDLGSAHTGSGYLVKADGQFEPSFQALSLRLRVGEVGVCESERGYHVIQRLPDEPR